jgi:hypothetical protein
MNQDLHFSHGLVLGGGLFFLVTRCSKCRRTCSWFGARR